MGKIKINYDLLDVYVKKSDYIELETELQRAKAKNNQLIDDNFQIAQKYTKLEQENEKLKEEIEQHKKEKQILHERLYCYAYEKDCHIVCKQQNCILKNGYTYRNTLEEIKEIADEMLKGVSENCIKTTPYLETYKQIQDKISEVME